MIQRFDNVANRNDGTAAISGGTAVTAITATTKGRQAIQICNHSLYDIWLMFTERSASAPTISSTSKDGVIPAGTDKTIGAGDGVAVWLISADASNTAAFTAVELR